MNLLPITKERYLKGLKHRMITPLSWPQQFTPFAAERKATDSCVIANAIPKSGTHLLKSIVTYLEKWEDIGVHLNVKYWDNKELAGEEEGVRRDCHQRYAVKKLRNGQVVAAHLYWSKAIEKTLSRVTPQKRVKHLFMYRDPRDTIVSQLRWKAYPENYAVSYSASEPTPYLRRNFRDDDERLTHLLQQPTPMGSDYLRYEPWLRNPDCFAVKFEDLYPEILNLKNNVIGDVLSRMLVYLEVDPSTINPLDFFEKVFGKSWTAAGDEDKIGRFRKVFKDHHYALVDNSDYRHVLQTFGYEW